MNKNFSLLQNFDKSNFYIDPFPHVVIDNALPSNIYDELEKSVPNDLFSQADLKLNNCRINIFPDQLKNDLKHKIWFDFLAYHNSLNFYEEFISIFKNEINKLYPNLINKQKKKFLLKHNVRTMRNKDSAFTIKKGETLFISTYGCNTPVKTPTSVQNPHLDHSNKFYFGLYYLRPEKDKSEGGDLVIYRWKDNYSNFKKKNIIFTEKWNNMHEHVNPVKTIEYKKNSVIFGLNLIDSLHGVTVRQKTNHMRQLAYFAVALDKDLGFTTPNLFEKLLFKNISLKDKFIIIIKSFWLILKRILYPFYKYFFKR